MLAERQLVDAVLGSRQRPVPPSRKVRRYEESIETSLGDLMMRDIHALMAEGAFFVFDIRTWIAAQR